MRNSIFSRFHPLEIALYLSLGLGLTLLTIPYFEKFSCRSKQSEAKYILARLYTAQKWYLAQEDRLAPLAELLAQEAQRIPPLRYHYESSAETTKENFKFQARAFLKSHATPDIWEINHKGALNHPQNGCG